MKTTNKELINILLWSWIKPNMLVNSFSIVWKLIKRHGRMLFTDKYVSEISDVDQNIWSLISILKSTNKTSHQDTKDLIKLTKEITEDYHREFNVVSDSKDHNEKIKDNLDAKFQDAKIHTHISSEQNRGDCDHLWVRISWEWRYFKKDLDSDLEKLLK